MKVVCSCELDLNISCQNVVTRVNGLHKSSSTGKVYFIQLSAGIVQEADVKVAQPILAALDSVVNIHTSNLRCGFEVYTPPRLRHVASMEQYTRPILDAIDSPVGAILLWSCVISA
jgi:hypothetical protein